MQNLDTRTRKRNHQNISAGKSVAFKGHVLLRRFPYLCPN